MSETPTLVEQLRARAQLDIAAADEIERLQRADRNAAFSRLHKLFCDLNEDRYGRPLIAALGLCLDLADELSALTQDNVKAK